MHRVYVINMDRSTRRWHRWKQETRVDVVRIRAIDGYKDLRRSDDHLFRRANFSNPAVKGCALSHLKAMRHSLHQNDAYALICEDDVILNCKTSERINATLDALPSDWRIVFFTRSPNHSRLPFSQPLREGVWNFSGCSMYMIRRDAIIEFLRHVEGSGFEEAVDWELIKFFPDHLLHPYGAYTLDGTSTIDLRRLVFDVRRLVFVMACLGILVVVIMTVVQTVAMMSASAAQSVTVRSPSRPGFP